MNIFKIHSSIINDYKSYIQSFINIKDKKIREKVDNELHSKKLWPNPLIQFNPSFAAGESVGDLVKSGNLHPNLAKAFSDESGKTWGLYRHQVDAIKLGSQGKSFIVTSGTGSGKSLTYISTIFNDIFKNPTENGIRAIVVYPMNALINSQFLEMEKYRKNFERSGMEFKIDFKQYTGQEDETEREKIRNNPPHILLTNYMMLELIMTRGAEDSLRTSIKENLKFLVFDELHTYRGRQGADVSMLIRRIKTRAQQNVLCIGTSATMVAGKDTTIQQQKEKVAEIGSIIFGTEISSAQIVNESLVKSLASIKITHESLTKAVLGEISIEDSAKAFENNPLAIWLESEIALDEREGTLVRRKPLTIPEIEDLLHDATGIDKEKCSTQIQVLLSWANKINSSDDKTQNYLPFKIHQFIAQTGSVYVTLDSPEQRQILLEAGLYSPKDSKPIFPVVFSRNSGHEFICVKLNYSKNALQSRNFRDYQPEDDEDDDENGYLIFDYKNEDAVWDWERDNNYLPDSWIKTAKKTGERTIQKKYEDRIPRKIFFDETGKFSFEENLSQEAWFMTAPLLFDPTSGSFFDTKTNEGTKLISLGGEGRSTATTVLSFSVIKQLHNSGIEQRFQKLLSFTDPRQDSSLQAGHFNDFIKVGQLRSGILHTLKRKNGIDYSNIASEVFETLALPQSQFAKNPSDFPGPAKENENAFKDYIMYRLLYDLRRSWRIVLPNLEQCALLNISYKYLNDTCVKNELWSDLAILNQMNPTDRMDFIQQLLDFFRRAYALYYSLLEPNVIEQKTRIFHEKLKLPWTLDKNEEIDYPSFLRAETLAPITGNTYTDSVGSRSVFGKYVKTVANHYGIDLRGEDNYKEYIYKLLDKLEKAGWLKSKKVKNVDRKDVPIYQLMVDKIIWSAGDGITIIPDKVRNRSYKENLGNINKFFQTFYLQNFRDYKNIEGKEHTGQINHEDRKIREDNFRSGDLSVLFCSPTMELGIDIADLNVVHLRNVPPTPANYAQRSGRAGRSGQAALVFSYCSNYSPHDRHYFKHATDMVAGSVTPPKIDLLNEELLVTHLNASCIAVKGLDAFDKSLDAFIDKDQLQTLPLTESIKRALALTQAEKTSIITEFHKIISDNYFQSQLILKKPYWFNDSWIKGKVDSLTENLNTSLDRWRILYQSAQNQITRATHIINNRIYDDKHQKKRDAYNALRTGERQRELLLNEPTSGRKKKDLSEFYPYRYFASEGFLPGYNFTRLPLRSFMENSDTGGEYISRPRFIALREFGPGNIIYHDGTKYRINQIIIPEAEAKLHKASASKFSGYFITDKEKSSIEVDPFTGDSLSNQKNRNDYVFLLEMAETRAEERERITCSEEERTSRGFDIKTYFHFEREQNSMIESHVFADGDLLLKLHYIPAATIVQVNEKWRVSKSQEGGFRVNLKTGFWLKEDFEIPQDADPEQYRKIKLFTSDTANAIYIQPVGKLAVTSRDDVVTLQYALKRAIENYFQIESREIGAMLMGETERPNILIYEAAEGSLGVLSQLVENVDAFKSIIDEAYKICFYKNGVPIPEDELLPASYDDLLSYYNQRDHQSIDKRNIRDALQRLLVSTSVQQSNNKYSSYEEHYAALEKARDPNSDTEKKFLKYLFENGLRLPDTAQPDMDAMYVRPDFLYLPNIVIFCDGKPHDGEQIKVDDKNKREALKSGGYQVLIWHYLQPLGEFVKSRQDIFRKVKESNVAAEATKLFDNTKSRHDALLKKLSE